VESGELAQYAAMAGYYGVPTIMVTGDEATVREAKRFFGNDCITVAVKKGIGRESAILYPFEDTRKALYDGAKRALAAVSRCKPYTLDLPVKVKVQYFEKDAEVPEFKQVTREGTAENALHILDF
jgi:D-amino peptidase